MGQILHGSATTTHAVRAAIQRSKAPLKELAAQHGLNHKTVAKWRKRSFVRDAPEGTQDSKLHSTVFRGRGYYRCLPQAHAAAARRLSLCVADDHSTPDQVVPASATRRDNLNKYFHLSLKLYRL